MDYPPLTDATNIALLQRSSITSHKNDKVDEDPNVSYWELLSTNRNYRLCICSYLISRIGEWLTYIASIEFIETQLRESDTTTSRMYVSILVVMRLIPSVLLACFGGTLADARDRRETMIALDIGGALCALLFVGVYYSGSIFLIYVVTFCQMSIAGLYQPCCSSIIPLMVQTNQALQKATTLQAVAWSVTASIGSCVGGYLVAFFGSRNCFLIDSATYLCSAIFLWMVRGKYDVSEESLEEFTSPWHQFQSMVVDGSRYLRKSHFGGLVFLKATAALAYGASDVLNVAFSEIPLGVGSVNGDNVDASTASTTTIATIDESSQRLGYLFACMGLGAFVGPLISEPLIDMDRPATLQISSISGFALIALGYFGWEYWDPATHPFWHLGITAGLRSMGSTIVWTHSCLLLQHFSVPSQLGRVMSVDYAFALLLEALSVALCGFLIDTVGLPVDQICFLMAIVATLSGGVWWRIYCLGYGAAAYSQATPDKEESSECLSESTPLAP